MATAKLVTFDVYMALLDIEGSLVPIVRETLGLSKADAVPFVRTWRAKQMERAASSNSLELERTRFRDATRMGLEYVAGCAGIEIDRDSKEALVLAWDRMKPWPEADSVIAAVKEKGCAVAILSNGDQDMLEAVADNFESDFDHVLSSESAGKYKPHPAVYGLPMVLLGIAMNDVLHVAGSPNDVLGAIAAGMRCAWSNRHGDRLLDTCYPATAELPDLRGVPDLL
jgi:2-haloacid dehalogenase